MTTELTPAVRTTAPFVSTGASSADNIVVDGASIDSEAVAIDAELLGPLLPVDGKSTAEGDN